MRKKDSGNGVNRISSRWFYLYCGGIRAHGAFFTIFIQTSHTVVYQTCTMIQITGSNTRLNSLSGSHRPSRFCRNCKNTITILYYSLLEYEF